MARDCGPLSAGVGPEYSASRSEAIRLALQQWVEQKRRSTEARRILDGYRRIPETEEELAWAETGTRLVIEAEPW
ncbi:MAG: hypothetical protein ACYDH5_04395 [Acidimicrobiales bacterium]